MNTLNLSKNDGVNLKPCPFCGGNRVGIKRQHDLDTDGSYYRIECRDCGVGTKERFAYEACPIFFDGIRNEWNRRHNETPSEYDRLCGRENSNV